MSDGRLNLRETESALHFVQLLWHSDLAMSDMFAGKSLVTQALQLCTAPDEWDDRPNVARFRASAISTASLLGDSFPSKHRGVLEKVMLDAAQGVQDLVTACETPYFTPYDHLNAEYIV